MRTLILAVLLSSTAAFAQTAGDATRGNTPPGKSQDGSGPADGAVKGGSILPGEAAGVPNKDSTTAATERLKRCDELRGTLREDCLEKERNAASGSSAPRERGKDAPIEREKDLKRSPD
ncbi:MAG TPA: hypothetical protein VGJ74_09860 [Burkholderiales bacterium]